MSTHDGHRQRMKNAFAEHGLESFDDVHALEFLLFYVRARCNTNEIAHELLDRFGSLDAVFEASVEELSNVDGVGPGDGHLPAPYTGGQPALYDEPAPR